MSEQPRLNTAIVLAATIAALSGLLFGFDTAVIAGTTRELTDYFRLTPVTLGFTVSFALWGTLLGALFAAVPAEQLGGRDSLRVTGVLYLSSALGCAFAHNWYAFLFFRFVGGVAIGSCSIFAPMYIAEISPDAIRGKLVACFQLSIVGGIMVAYASNFALGRLRLGMYEWRADLGVAAVPALVFALALASIPRSPTWLVMKGKYREAKEALSAFGFQYPAEEVHRIATSLQLASKQGGASLYMPAYRRSLFIGIALVFFNQMSGVNAVLYYLNDIFARAGFASVSAQSQAVTVGIANFLFTLVGMTLIDRVGRKILLTVGALSMAVALLGVAIVFYSNTHFEWLLPLLAIFIACFAASQGVVVWVYLSEIFPSSIRARAQSLSSFILWLMNAIISGLFPIVANVSRGSAFLAFSLCMVAQFFVVSLVFPETRGRSLDSVELLPVKRTAYEN